MSAAIFNGTAVKILKNTLRFKDNTNLTSTQVTYLNTITSDVQAQLDAKVDESREGAANGIATLDGGGKIPSTQLPNSVMEYKGNWAASTNTPTLADGSGNAGDVYQAMDAGTVNFGAGNITFAAGDYAVYSGTVWQKSINSNAVASVNSFTGIVSLDTDDIPEGSSLYYTDERAQDSVGTILTNSGTINFTYNDTTPSITAVVPNGSISTTQIAAFAGITYAQLSIPNSIVNNDIAAGAAIVYAKLNLATSIVNADISNSAAIAYSKLNLATSIVNADIAVGAAIDYNKLNLATSIVNADINASAAIALSKLAATTASRALVSDASGFVTASSVTSATLAFLDATSSVQTQLNNKIGYSLTSISGNTSAASGTTYLVDTSGGTVAVTLPAPAANIFVTVKDIGSAETNNITVLPNGAETIDGSSSDVISSSYGSATYVSNATNWFRL